MEVEIVEKEKDVFFEHNIQIRVKQGKSNIWNCLPCLSKEELIQLRVVIDKYFNNMGSD